MQAHGSKRFIPRASHFVSQPEISTAVGVAVAYTPQFTRHTPHATRHTPHPTVHSLQSTIYNLQSTVYRLPSTVYNPHHTRKLLIRL